ncbi:MAG: stage II sporulation protein P [Clostridia bacterium]|nr:stage II sporulation protein P [Clostridia bacterium]
MKFKKRRKKIRLNGRTAAYLFFALAIVLLAPYVLLFGSKHAAVLTGLSFPQGALRYYGSMHERGLSSGTSPEESAGEVSFADRLPQVVVSEIAEIQQSDGRMGQPPDIPDSRKGEILQMHIEGAGENYGSIWVKNETGNEIDIREILESPSPLDITDKSLPTVLIYHTHTTEAFMTYDTGWFDIENTDRSDDLSLGVCAVGDVVARRLQSAGIGVIHDTKVYDSPMYSGAYKRSAETIRHYLGKYPSVKIVLDIHRDSMIRNKKLRIRPTVKVNGKNAAQIMIISGCEDDSSLEMPNWRDNLNLAIKLQNAMENLAPGIMRPISFKIAQYNQQYSSGGLLLEVGTDVNTIDDALNSATVLGDALVDVIEKIHAQ